MSKITSFAIFKNNEAEGNKPQYRMVGKPEDANKEEKSVELAGLWVKEHNGNKYYSGKMKSEFTKDDGTKLNGYVIITEEEYASLKAGNSSQGNTGGNNDTSDEPDNIPLDQIPF